MLTYLKRREKMTKNAKKIIKKVNKILAKEGKSLPKRGYLAGQAVSSLYLGVGPVNDIDVFVPSKISSKRRSLSIRESIEPSEHLAGYRYIFDNCLQEKYTMVRTKTIGRLNITMFEQTKDIVTAKDLIEMFDINCTQIAIDLETEEIVFTDAFAEFERTRRLEISNLATPSHSMMRILKKSDEIDGSMLDIDTELSLAATYSQYVNVSYFGKKHYDYYVKYKNILDKYVALYTSEKGTFIFGIAKDFKSDQKEIFNCSYMLSEKGKRVVAKNIRSKNQNRIQKIKILTKMASLTDSWWIYDAIIDSGNIDFDMIEDIMQALSNRVHLRSAFANIKSYDELLSLYENIKDAEATFGRIGMLAISMMNNASINPQSFMRQVQAKIAEISREFTAKPIDVFAFEAWSFSECNMVSDLYPLGCLSLLDKDFIRGLAHGYNKVIYAKSVDSFAIVLQKSLDGNRWSAVKLYATVTGNAKKEMDVVFFEEILKKQYILGFCQQIHQDRRFSK
jgi:hypothetical protein